MRSLFRSLFSRRPMEPLIAVVGATGTGKSKLAVDLATRFNGEIINGDAMQMYRGLPIITNQIPIEERNGIPHHLISCIDLHEEPWRVGLFKNECLRIIKDIHGRGKIPVLVGGTHYYTQTVLFKDQLVGDGEVERQSTDDEEDSAVKWPILNASPEVVLQKLKEVDPVMAGRWHPNETRKIRRSLEIYFQTGRPASEVYAEQKRQRQSVAIDPDSSRDTGQLRFPTVIFWVHSEKETLNARLEKRVENMIEQGLMAEAQHMSNYLRKSQAEGVSVDRTRGVWVSIGFKELAPYFEALYSGTSSETELDALRKICMESVKTATRQYAVSQIKWIRNKLWTALAETGMKDRLYLLDSTNVDAWKKCVTEPSERIVQCLLNRETAPDPKSLSKLAMVTLNAREAQEQKSSSSEGKCFTCEVCRKTMTNEDQWNIHLNGHAHKRALKGAVRKAERDEYLRKRQEALENTQKSEQ
ncbi:IPP transferase-domain-containing protein [Aspergillus ambiguus]|uniref:tRNA dimethylallyltransferase n=1 Tax=Aspergillus ambiguus TaxID=176160 RepID=UPI003CCD675E